MEGYASSPADMRTLAAELFDEARASFAEGGDEPMNLRAAPDACALGAFRLASYALIDGLEPIEDDDERHEAAMLLTLHVLAFLRCCRKRARRRNRRGERTRRRPVDGRAPRMLSAQEGAKQARWLHRERERGTREAAARTLRELRDQLHVARAQRNEALASAKAQCRSERLSLREKALARRQRALAELREAYKKERAEARDVCLLRKADVHASSRDPIERAKGKWEAERTYQADLRLIEQGNRERHRHVHRAHAAERQSESDDEVRGNIPPDYQSLFERVKRTIKGSSRESRTEAFLRYAEQHPNELLAALDDQSDRVVRELEEQRAKAERALRSARRE